MRKKYKIWLIIISILIVLAGGIGISKLFMKTEKPNIKNITNVISNIKDFGYTLDDRDTKYMQEAFKELEDVLASSEIDYQEYAKILAKLFVIDFYTLNNKINKYDVGSLEYIYSKHINEFKNKAMDTIYGDIIDNSYKDRVQDLPEITAVEIINVSTENIKIADEEKESYKVTMKYTYKEDLGFDSEGTVYLIKNKNKLEVAIYNPKVVTNNN